ncbi:MAG TPA: mechanosensitive ion channel family protein [Acidobacteriaceae bacterium]|jgi:small-conductance mechanosensitive channel|nr:mechanosensitive ion channel family protein [Acidobacteriaceae bacterium]
MSTPLSPTPRAPRPRIFTHTRLLVLFALLGGLALCFVLSWSTRDAVANLAFLRARRGAAHSPVDLRPWQTAQTLASLAVTTEEHDYAREAERLADHDVDQAFAAALRAAQLQSRHQTLTGEALTLSRRVAQLQHEVEQDQAVVNRLKATAASPPAASKSVPAAGSDALQVAQAQLGLDSDQLTDAQHDLDRATGNASVIIQNELASHEASMRQYEQQQQSGDGQTAVVTLKRKSTLVERLRSWFSQRSRYASLQQAMAEAQTEARTLTGDHNALESQMNAATSAAPLTLSQIQDRSTQRQILSIDDDRIQTDQQLATVYSRWSSQVLLQHRIMLHLILQSLEIILLIVLGMILGDALVRRLMERPSLGRRQLQTLRTIFEVGVQVIGLVLIVMVLVGPPQQTATMIGLATAALTIALQDYILAFIGWFMLVGKNGIRIGDRVEINGVCGEVIDFRLMSTSLLETTGLAQTGEPTGRTVTFLNSYAIRGQLFNFSSEGQWLWDEITVTLPAGEDIDALAHRIENAAREETQENARLAEQEWQHSARATALSRLSAAPVVALRPSGGGIDLQLRYVTRASARFEVRDRLYRRVLQLLHEKARDSHPAGSQATLSG